MSDDGDFVGVAAADYSLSRKRGPSPLLCLPRSLHPDPAGADLSSIMFIGIGQPSFLQDSST